MKRYKVNKFFALKSLDLLYNKPNLKDYFFNCVTLNSKIHIQLDKRLGQVIANYGYYMGFKCCWVNSFEYGRSRLSLRLFCNQANLDIIKKVIYKLHIAYWKFRKLVLRQKRKNKKRGKLVLNTKAYLEIKLNGFNEIYKNTINKLLEKHHRQQRIEYFLQLDDYILELPPLIRPTHSDTIGEMGFNKTIGYEF